MTVSLRDRVAMSAALQSTIAIGIDDALECFPVMLLKPTQQCWAKVETDVRVVIYKPLPCFSFVDANESVRTIAFSMNALVPIVKRWGAWLLFYYSRPVIVARRLIKMAVHDEKGHSGQRVSWSINLS